MSTITWARIIFLFASWTTALFAAEHHFQGRSDGNISIYLGQAWEKEIIFQKDEDGSINIKLFPSKKNSTSHVPSCQCYPDQASSHNNSINTTASTSTSKFNIRVQETRLNFNKLALNMTGNNYTGNDIKMALKEVNDSTLNEVGALYLSHNNISELPPFTFPNNLEFRLQQLHLDHNDMQYWLKIETWHENTLHCELCRLHSLSVLNLSHTRQIGDYYGLKYLYLPHLFHLDLSHNQVNHMLDLRGLPGLDVLDLTGNVITNTSNVVLFNYTMPKRLRTLLLADNQINDIDGLISRIKNPLWKLDLSNNSLTDASAIAAVDYKEILISGNPWACSCALVSLVSRDNVTDRELVTCTLDGVMYRWPMLNLSAHLGCPSHSAGAYLEDKKTYQHAKEWLRTAGDTLGDVMRYMEYHLLPFLLLVSSILGWGVLFYCIVCMLFRRDESRTQVEGVKVEEKKSETSVVDIPYSKLTLQQVN